MQAIAKFNMTFDNDNFIKGKSYHFRQDGENIYVKGEKNKEQKFYFLEFEAIFTKEDEGGNTDK